MATRNPLVRAFASAASRVWFPATLACTRNLPRLSMHRGSRRLATMYYGLRPKYLQAARRNLSIILDLPEDAPRVRETAFAMVVSHFHAWVDFLHFATRRPEEAARIVEGVVGYSRIVEGRLRNRRQHREERNRGQSSGGVPRAFRGGLLLRLRFSRRRS